MSSKYEVLLEKKGRGRGLVSITRPWAVRTFKLVGQNLEYYDGDKLKGTIEIGGSSVGKLTGDEADGKPFPFFVDNKKEKLLLNASCEEIRLKSMEIFSLAAGNANWSLPDAYEKAASKAVIGIMSGDAEKARLEAEQKRLEAERLQEVTSGTAALMAEELANKQLREAREAEEKQREEQERQAAELFKSMGAKARFFAALKQGNKKVAREAAAVMLQGAWRSKVARRRMVLKKQEKEQKLRSGYARKIQSRYRARLARKKVEAIKKEKLLIKQKLCVLKVQCAWRIYVARKKFKAKQESKLHAEYNKSVSKQRGIIKVQNAVRSFIATRNVAKMKVAHPSVVFATVTKAEGLNVSDAAHADPVVIVSGMTLSLPADHPALHKPNVKIMEDIIKTHGKITSIYRVDSVSQKKPALATSLNKMDYIAITLIDKNSKDDFLGQSLIRLTDLYPLLKNGARSVDVTVPLASHLLVPLVDANKDSLVTVRKAATGKVTVTVTFPDPAYSMCGWLWKVSESLLTNAWKKRWFVMVDGQLQYFNTDLMLDQPKNVVITKTISSIKEEAHKGRNATKISFQVNGVDSFWVLDFDESAPKFIKNMWLRKFYRNSLLEDPTLHVKSKKVKTSTTDSSISPQPKARVPVSKRMSIFK